MTCDEVRGLLHPYTDGELDLVRQVEVERHLGGCAGCAARVQQLRSLSAALAAPSLYHPAPTALRDRIRTVAVPSTGRRRFPVRSLALAASILLALASAAAIGMLVGGRGLSDDDRHAEAVVVGHVRSLQVEHVTDVVSTDRHTVKPWFQGKLDFAPPVPDLAADGYRLAGGRLDYLTDRPVAAVVYHCRLHPINVFLWAAADDSDKPVRSLTRRGLHLRAWQQAGITVWVVSDLGDPDLDDFVRRFQEHSRAATP